LLTGLQVGYSLHGWRKGASSALSLTVPHLCTETNDFAVSTKLVADQPSCWRDSCWRSKLQGLLQRRDCERHQGSRQSGTIDRAFVTNFPECSAWDVGVLFSELFSLGCCEVSLFGIVRLGMSSWLCVFRSHPLPVGRTSTGTAASLSWKRAKRGRPGTSSTLSALPSLEFFWCGQQVLVRSEIQTGPCVNRSVFQIRDGMCGCPEFVHFDRFLFEVCFLELATRTQPARSWKCFPSEGGSDLRL